MLGELVSGVEIILLDDELEHEVQQGEICIRGPCLAAGYRNDEQEKFFFRNGVRHYRTGDLARRNADHSLSFVARRNADDSLSFVACMDRIVKNRGCLVDLETEVRGVVGLRCDSPA